MNIIKFDVLSEMDEFKIGVVYEFFNGKIMIVFLVDIVILENVKVVYEILFGWKIDIVNVRFWDDMFENVKKYIFCCEEFLGVECCYIGVGLGCDVMVIKL